MKQTLIRTDVTVIGEAQALDTAELARACGAQVEWVEQLVAFGVIGAEDSKSTEPCFYSADLSRALDARRLERDFGVGLEAAALILDLSREVRRLKKLLHTLGHDSYLDR